MYRQKNKNYPQVKFINMWIRKGNIFDRHHSQVPVVDTDNENFWRIYYSKRINNKSYPFYIDVEMGNPHKILNESEKPILKLGDIGKFDVSGIMPTEIIKVGDLKYLYYIGWTNRFDVPYHNTLGLAVSNDNGNTWEKFSDGPIFGTSYKEPGYVGTISILKQNDEYHGFYLSCRQWKIFDNKPEPIYDIKHSISSNGIDWTPLETAINLENDEGGISKASVIDYEGKFLIWYSVRKENDYRTNPKNSYRIKCSQSNDLINWKKINKYNLDIDPLSEWDNIMVEYPHIIKYNNKLFMFYNGNGFGKTGIGYATI